MNEKEAFDDESPCGELSLPVQRPASLASIRNSRVGAVEGSAVKGRTNGFNGLSVICAVAHVDRVQRVPVGPSAQVPPVQESEVVGRHVASTTPTGTCP